MDIARQCQYTIERNDSTVVQQWLKQLRFLNQYQKRFASEKKEKRLNSVTLATMTETAEVWLSKSVPEKTHKWKKLETTQRCYNHDLYWRQMDVHLMSNQLLEKNGRQDMPTCDLASIVSQHLWANHPPISKLLQITNLWENVENFGQPVYPSDSVAFGISSWACHPRPILTRWRLDCQEFRNIRRSVVQQGHYDAIVHDPCSSYHSS